MTKELEGVLKAVAYVKYAGYDKVYIYDLSRYGCPDILITAAETTAKELKEYAAARIEAARKKEENRLLISREAMERKAEKDGAKKVAEG